MGVQRDDAKPSYEPPTVGGLPPTLRWVGGVEGQLDLLDQTLLPQRVERRLCRTAEDVWEAIRELRVRGAPAIGLAAAFGVCLGTRGARSRSRAEFRERVQAIATYLKSARPTAVNLEWAVERVAHAGLEAADRADSAAAWATMLAEAEAMLREDVETCRRIGEAGADLIPDGGGVLTHCNAGALATGAYGTALALLYVAHARGRRFEVFVDETRPLLQGARLTAYELTAAGLNATLLCDSAAASLMGCGGVQLVVVGADRIAANGDTANKIGTYGLALSARAHGIPFYVAAPRSTFDLGSPDGSHIPIEMRSEDEVRFVAGAAVAPAGVACFNPAFDVTPAILISGIVTEAGIIRPVEPARIRAVVQGE